MGRHRKYYTEEDQRKANLLRSTNYYWRNKEKIDEKRKRQYHEKKDKLSK